MIQCLKELHEKYDSINGKTDDLFLQLIDLTKEMRGPHLIMDSILLSKEQLQEHMDALKVEWENEFNEITEYSQEEVEKWLIHYVNKNDEVEDTLYQLSFDIRDIETELFNAKIKHETMVTPMQEYIEVWLKKALIKLTKPYQPKLVTNAMETPSKDYKKHRDKKMNNMISLFHHSKSSNHIISFFSISIHPTFLVSKSVKTKGRPLNVFIFFLPCISLIHGP